MTVMHTNIFFIWENHNKLALATLEYYTYLGILLSFVAQLDYQTIPKCMNKEQHRNNIKTAS